MVLKTIGIGQGASRHRSRSAGKCGPAGMNELGRGRGGARISARGLEPGLQRPRGFWDPGSPLDPERWNLPGQLQSRVKKDLGASREEAGKLVL